MKIQVRTYRWTGWIAPAVILIALALIPFALMLALGIAAAGLGAFVFRSLLPQTGGTSFEEGPFADSNRKKFDSDYPAIDADYEVKEENEKR